MGTPDKSTDAAAIPAAILAGAALVAGMLYTVYTVDKALLPIILGVIGAFAILLYVICAVAYIYYGRPRVSEQE